MKRSVCVAYAFYLLSSCVALAGTIAGTGGSTEITQLMNNAELVSSVAKQAAMVEQQVQTNITAIQQYMTMMTNLKNLPTSLLNQTIAPYAQQVNDLRQVFSAVESLKQASDDTKSVLSRRLGEMQSLKMTPQTYLNAESALAAKKGGIYQAQMQADLAKIGNLQQRAEQLRTLAATPIAGNVEGLQLLNQQSNMMVGEIMDLKAAILQQNIIANQERAEREQAKAAANSASAANADIEDRRDQRNQDFTNRVQFKPSWMK